MHMIARHLTSLGYDHFKKKILAAKGSHFIDEKLEVYLSNGKKPSCLG